jgi:hypothetical protein
MEGSTPKMIPGSPLLAWLMRVTLFKLTRLCMDYVASMLLYGCFYGLDYVVLLCGVVYGLNYAFAYA